MLITCAKPFSHFYHPSFKGINTPTRFNNLYNIHIQSYEMVYSLKRAKCYPLAIP